MTADTPTGPLVERVARALREALEALDTPDNEGIYTSTFTDGRMVVDGVLHLPSLAADLLRRAGIGEPVGLAWGGYPDYQQAPVPFGGAYYVRERHGEWLAELGSLRIGDPLPTPEAARAARAACEADYAARLLGAGYVPAGTPRYDVMETLEEGLDVLYNFQNSVREHGNYTQESTIVFLDQAASSIRYAIRALATSPAPVVASPQETTPVDDSERPDGSDTASLIEQALTEWFGPRCPDYDEGCDACRAWREYDGLREPASPSGAVSADAVRAEIAWHENAKSLALKMAEGNPNPHTAATLRCIADAHNEAHARLSALLPPEETKP